MTLLFAAGRIETRLIRLFGRKVFDDDGQWIGWWWRGQLWLRAQRA